MPAEPVLRKMKKKVIIWPAPDSSLLVASRRRIGVERREPSEKARGDISGAGFSSGIAGEVFDNAGIGKRGTKALGVRGKLAGDIINRALRRRNDLIRLFNNPDLTQADFEKHFESILDIDSYLSTPAKARFDRENAESVFIGSVLRKAYHQYDKPGAQYVLKSFVKVIRRFLKKQNVPAEQRLEFVRALVEEWKRRRIEEGRSQ